MQESCYAPLLLTNVLRIARETCIQGSLLIFRISVRWKQSAMMFLDAIARSAHWCRLILPLSSKTERQWFVLAVLRTTISPLDLSVSDNVRAVIEHANHQEGRTEEHLEVIAHLRLGLSRVFLRSDLAQGQLMRRFVGHGVFPTGLTRREVQAALETAERGA